MRKLLKRRPSPAMVVAFVAVFVSLTGVAWASHITGRQIRDNSIGSGDIRNDGVVSADIKGGGGKTGTIKNRDMNQVLAIAKGFATVNGDANPGAVRVLSSGGAQTNARRTSVARVLPGLYDVTFNSDPGVGGYANLTSGDQVAAFATARDAAPRNASVQVIGASSGQVRIRVDLRARSGRRRDSDVSVAFYTNIPAPR